MCEKIDELMRWKVEVTGAQVLLVVLVVIVAATLTMGLKRLVWTKAATAGSGSGLSSTSGSDGETVKVPVGPEIELPGEACDITEWLHGLARSTEDEESKGGEAHEVDSATTAASTASPSPAAPPLLAFRALQRRTRSCPSRPWHHPSLLTRTRRRPPALSA